MKHEQFEGDSQQEGNKERTERREVLILIEKIKDQNLKDHAFRVLDSVEDATRSGNLSATELAVALPNLLFAMSEKQKNATGVELIGGDDMRHFRDFQTIMQDWLNEKRAEIRPAMTDERIQRFKESMQEKMSRGNFDSARAWLSYNEIMLEFQRKLAPGERNLTEAGIEAMEQLIVQFRQQLESQ